MPVRAPSVAGTPRAVIARAESAEAIRARAVRSVMPPQPGIHGTGQGLRGVLPAAAPPRRQAMAYAAPSARNRHREPSVQQASAPKPVAPHRLDHPGRRLEAKAKPGSGSIRPEQGPGLLGKADPFTETVAKGDKKLYRARFAGLDKDQAEAACKTLKRNDISCITIKNLA